MASRYQAVLERGLDRVPTLRDQISEGSDRAFQYLMILPSFIYIFLILGIPAIYLVYLSMHENFFSVIRETQFVGLDNIVAVLTAPSFWTFFLYTVVYTVGVVGVGIVLQLGIALVLNMDLPYRRIWQTLIILPWASPVVLSTIMWRFMFIPNFGVINYLLIQIGLIDSSIAWFSSQPTAFFTVIQTTIWYNTPLGVLILLAGLSTIPDDVYEAAKIDGAGIWARFRYVTLPLLRPALSAVLLIETLFALRGFEVVYAMTQGGPGTSTTIIVVDIYQQLIQYGNTSYAAAEAVILIGIILITLIVLNRVLSTREEVEVQ